MMHKSSILIFFLAGVTLYSVPTQALKDNVEDLGPFVSVHGEKVKKIYFPQP